MDNIREDILQKRYYWKDDNGNPIEDWSGLCKRVATNIAMTDQEATDFYEMLHNCKFLPNTPALVNAGRPNFSYSACYVLDVEDSIESIYETIKNTAKIHKTGGGTGYNFSKLRPKNDIVGTTKGVASGPLSFMKVFNASTEAIKQGGVRRGASIGILNINHPDIEEFIKAKTIDGEINNFNISIGITDDFIIAVKEDMDFELKFKDNLYKTVKAKYLWEMLINSAWENGEPGIIFIDTINKYNTLPGYGKLSATNPCVIGETLVAVADGRDAISIKILAEEGKDVPIYTLDLEKEELCVKWGRNARKTGTKAPVFKVNLTNNESITVTENHKFILSSGEEKTTSELTPGDSLYSFSKHQYPNTTKGKLYWNLSSKSKQCKEHELISDFFYGKIDTNLFSRHHINGDSLDNRKENIQIIDKGDHNRIHSDVKGEKNPMFGKKHSLETKEKIRQKSIERMKNDEYRESYSGKIKKAWEIYRDSFDKGFHKRAETKLEECKTKTNLPCFLIDNSVFIRRFCEVCGKEMILSFGRREHAYCSRSCQNKGRKKLYTVLNDDLLKMGKDCEEKMGLTWNSWQKYKEINSTRPSQELLKQRFGSFNLFKDKVATYNHKVISVEFVGYEDVYNITVDDWHNVCYITEKEGKTKNKGFPRMRGIITRQCGEIPLFPQEACCLGSLNLTKFINKKGDWSWSLLKEVIYKAVRFLDNIIDRQHYVLSGIEKTQKSNRKIGLGIMGWADSLIKKEIKYNSNEALEEAEKVMEFINSTAIEASQKLAEEKGSFPNFDKSTYQTPMRNATVTTCAPTGSISIIAECSSGIEPIFDFETVQKRPVGEHNVIHPLYKEFKEKNPGKSLPNYFVTAKEIAPEWHVKMQATFQKHIQNSISKTINFSNTATKEDVEKVFFLSHELGCKSLTVYRDGSRKNQVITSAKDAKDSTDFEVLDAKRVQIATPNGNIYLNISFYKEKPIELFITTPDEAYKNCPKCNHIIAIGGGENYDALARIISLGLRHGIPAKKLIEQLEKANKKFGNLNSVPAAIMRAFAKLNMNGNKELCPDCNNILIQEENCGKCLICGYSRCS